MVASELFWDELVALCRSDCGFPIGCVFLDVASFEVVFWIEDLEHFFADDLLRFVIDSRRKHVGYRRNSIPSVANCFSGDSVVVAAVCKKSEYLGRDSRDFSGVHLGTFFREGFHDRSLCGGPLRIDATC